MVVFFRKRCDTSPPITMFSVIAFMPVQMLLLARLPVSVVDDGLIVVLLRKLTSHCAGVNNRHQTKTLSVVLYGVEFIAGQNIIYM